MHIICKSTPIALVRTIELCYNVNEVKLKMNTVNMTIRVDKDLKANVDSLFKNLGITTNSAINMFLKQCEREQSLVFTPSMLTPAPSKELAEALQEMEDYKNGKIQLDRFKTTEELFEYLDK